MSKQIIINSPRIEFVQDNIDGVICDFYIDKKNNPNMFKKNGSINNLKLRRLKIVMSKNKLGHNSSSTKGCINKRCLFFKYNTCNSDYYNGKDCPYELRKRS